MGIRSDTECNGNAWALGRQWYKPQQANANNEVAPCHPTLLTLYIWKDRRRVLLIIHVVLGGIEAQIECSAPLNPSLHCNPIIHVYRRTPELLIQRDNENMLISIALKKKDASHSSTIVIRMRNYLGITSWSWIMRSCRDADTELHFLRGRQPFWWLI